MISRVPVFDSNPVNIPILQKSCAECSIKNCSVLKYAEADCLNHISSLKKQRKFVAGQRIVMESTSARSVYFLEHGQVKIYKTDRRGREVILRFSKPGEIIGYNCCEESTEYQISAKALTDVIACCLDYKSFLELTKEYPGLNYELLRFYRKELIHTEKKALKLATMTVPEKVADALLYMHDSYGSGGKPSRIGIVLSRQDIASLAGTTKEQVSKVLSELKALKIIDTRGKNIDVINKERLEEWAGC